MVRLVFLGKFGDIAPAELGAVTLPDTVATLSGLRDWLAQQQPLLAQAMAGTSTRMVLNQKIVHDLSNPVMDGDEVAFLPPMSGG